MNGPECVAVCTKMTSSNRLSANPSLLRYACLRVLNQFVRMKGLFMGTKFGYMARLLLKNIQ